MKKISKLFLVVLVLFANVSFAQSEITVDNKTYALASDKAPVYEYMSVGEEAKLNFNCNFVNIKLLTKDEVCTWDRTIVATPSGVVELGGGTTNPEVEYRLETIVPFVGIILMTFAIYAFWMGWYISAFAATLATFAAFATTTLAAFATFATLATILAVVDAFYAAAEKKKVDKLPYFFAGIYITIMIGVLIYFI